MSLKTRIEAYQRLNTANDASLEILSEITSDDRKTTASSTESLFTSITAMYKSITELENESSEYYQELPAREYFSVLEQKIKDLRKKTNSVLTKQNESDGRVVTNRSPTVRRAFQQLYIRELSSLRRSLEGEFDPDDVKIADLATPHDVIRYMHQVATSLFFDPRGNTFRERSGHYSFEQGGLSLALISATADIQAETYFKNNPLLRRFKEIAQTARFRGKSTEKDIFKGIISEEKLTLLFQLGCHMATLEANHRRDETYSFNFKYTDSLGYSSSIFRARVVEAVLKTDDIPVERKDRSVTSRVQGLSEQAAVELFEKLLRLSVSIKNIDTISASETEGRLKDTVEAYHAGVLDLSNYINRCKPERYHEWLEESEERYGRKITKREGMTDSISMRVLEKEEEQHLTWSWKDFIPEMRWRKLAIRTSFAAMLGFAALGIYDLAYHFVDWSGKKASVQDEPRREPTHYRATQTQKFEKERTTGMTKKKKKNELKRTEEK